MAGIDDLFKNGLGGGIAVAVGAAVLAPVVGPVIGRVMRPLVKTAIKGGIVAYGWGRESFAEMQGYLEETYTEASAEMSEAETGGAFRGRGRAKAEGHASTS
jgi:hypothetical protein